MKKLLKQLIVKLIDISPRYDNKDVKEIKTILKANNSYFVSVLVQMDKKIIQLTKDMFLMLKLVKELDLSDILAGDYKENLKNLLNDKWNNLD